MSGFIIGKNHDETLAKSTAKLLKWQFKKLNSQQFPNGEVLIDDKVFNIKTNIILVIFSLFFNKDLIELIILLEKLHSCYSHRTKIIVFIPYILYDRQDQKHYNSVTTRDIIFKLIFSCNVKNIIFLDLHNEIAKNLVNNSSINWAIIKHHEVFYHTIKKYLTKNQVMKSQFVILSPDQGSKIRAEMLIKKLQLTQDNLGLIIKERLGDKIIMNLLHGNLEDKICFLIDDIVDSGKTLLNAIKFLKIKKVKKILIMISHLLLNNEEILGILERESVVQKIYYCNERNKNSIKKYQKIQQINIENPLCAQVNTMLQSIK